MTSEIVPDPPPPPRPPGGPGGGQPTLLGGRLIDLVSSVHHPGVDPLLPRFRYGQWDTLRALDATARMDVVTALAALQGLELALAVLQPPAGQPESWGSRQRPPRFLHEQQIKQRAASVCRRYGERADVRALFPKEIVDMSGSAPADIPPASAADTLAARWFFHLVDTYRGLGAGARQDLRTAWFDVRDQGATSGCSGWAVADLLWLNSGVALDPPSPRFLWQAAKETDGEPRPTTMIAGAGTSLRATLAVARRWGYARESEVPSDGAQLYPRGIHEFYRTIRRRRIASFVNLGRDAKLWLAWLASGRAVVCSLWATRELVLAERGRDVVTTYDPRQRGIFAHAVTIVGYRMTADKETLAQAGMRVDGTDPPERRAYPVQYLVRNTIGRHWGDQGYAWVDHAALRFEAMEGYGVLGRGAVDPPG